MRRLILFTALVAATPCMADDFCDSFGKVADGLMVGQQKGVPKSHALATLGKIGLASLVEVAYDSPAASTDEATAEQRAQFVAASTFYCREHKEDIFA